MTMNRFTPALVLGSLLGVLAIAEVGAGLRHKTGLMSQVPATPEQDRANMAIGETEALVGLGCVVLWGKAMPGRVKTMRDRAERLTSF